jgi:E3 ubiquitin-protein ligase UBR1
LPSVRHHVARCYKHFFKHTAASHFASIYHRVADAYLLVDREAETSIKYFALQLFTAPSVALHIVSQHDLMTRLLDLIVNFFTNHIEDKHILTTPPAKQDIDVESTPFRSKRFMPVFSDLRYLCHNRPVQQLIARHPAFIRKFVKVCQVFMCINPNKRVASNHVEYEADAWISVFNVTLSLSRVIKVYGEAFAFANPTQLVGAITTVVREILGVCTLSTDRLDKEKFSKPMLHDVEFGDAQYQIVDFNVLEGWVSFHHSLHWLLADLLKHVDILSEESLEQIGLSGVRDLFLRPFNEGAILTLIDFPLRGK